MNTLLNIYLDLSKAFDSLNHTSVLSKLEYYGVYGMPLNLFRTYLSNRKQYVQYESSSSDLSYIKQGVPQGSILGPLLFLIYTPQTFRCDIATKSSPINRYHRYDIV